MSTAPDPLGEREESDQLPEEQPAGAAPGTGDVDERRRDAGLGDGHAPTDRRATGNPHEDDGAGESPGDDTGDARVA